ncbi:MAG: hypothetical protein CMG29_02155 [Candidatus Marinimicrobia bacterium]|nr:hypothetical protein [Candidatus Neomarinimicrobiota bacterium]HBN45207.1 hypothetical protein [Candidatus Neomarinimicrobiota bacterium]
MSMPNSRTATKHLHFYHFFSWVSAWSYPRGKKKGQRGGDGLYKIIILLMSSTLLAQDEGLKAYQSGDYDNARKYYESILSEKDEDAAAQFGLGTTAFQQQDLQGALDAFQRALETDNAELQSKAYYNIANALASQQKNEEALAFYRKSLELDPSDKDAKHNYEMIRYQQQQQEQQQEQQDQNQDQEKQEQQEQQKQDQQDQEQQDQNQQNEQDQQEQRSQEEQQQQLAQEDEEKQQDLQHAQAILDALKKDEKVNQKRQMAKARSKKLEKDW